MVALVAIALCCWSFYQNCRLVLCESFDTGWLIRSGQYILQSGIPTHDIYSWTEPNRAYVIYQWLFTTFAAALYNAGGLWLLGGICCLISGMIYFFLLPYDWIRRGVPVALPFICLSPVLTAHWFNVRPQIFSYLLIFFFLKILETYRTRPERSKIIWLCLPLLVLWVNLHAFWIYALGILAIYAIADVIRKKRWTTAASVLAFSLPCVMLNPYGAHIATYIATFANGTQFMGMRETQPAFECWDCMPQLIYLVLSCALIWKQRKQLSWEAVIVSTTFLFAAAFVRRYESLAVIATWQYVGLALSVWSGGACTDRSGGVSRPPEVAVTEPAAAVPSARIGGFQPPSETIATKWNTALQLPFLLPLALILSAALYLIQFPSPSVAESRFYENSKPTLQFVLDHCDKDHFFNDPTTGSWLILCGAKNVFIDTRYDMYSRNFCWSVVKTLLGTSDWNKFFEGYNVRYLLVRNEFGLLHNELMQSTLWRPVIDDGTLTLWIRNDDRAEATLEKWELTDAAFLNKMPPHLSAKAAQKSIHKRCMQYFKLANRHIAKNEHEKAVPLLQKCLTHFPDSATLKDTLAVARKTK